MDYQWKCKNCGWLTDDELMPIGPEGYRCVHCHGETEEDIREDVEEATTN